MTLIVGDVQGCFDEWQDLLRTVQPLDSTEPIVFCGDLVNRGPKSLAMLRWIRDQGPRVRTVLGNHDLHFLAVVAGVRREGKLDTLGGLLEAPDLQELVDWLRRQPLLLRVADAAVVHAGLFPVWTIPQAEALSQQVSKALSAENWREHLQAMYGNEPTGWQASLSGTDRFRAIVNAMTRLRVLDANGHLLLHFKGALADIPSGAPPGALPWFDFPQRMSADTRIYCGHWSMLGLMQRPDVVALDTGCVWGGPLTAVRAETGAVFQYSSGKQYASTD